MTSGLISGHESRSIELDVEVDAIHMMNQTRRQLELADARTGYVTKRLVHPESSQLYLSDEDSAYAWALHHEICIRWFEARLEADSNLSDSEALARARAAHQVLRRWWIRQISLARWDQLYFSWSHP